MRLLGVSLVVSTALALVGSSCEALHRRSNRIPEWAAWPDGTFARVEVNFGRERANELAGFAEELSRLLDAPVGRANVNPGARFYANLARPAHVDWNAIRELARATPARAKLLYEMDFQTDWVFEGMTAVVRDTGQRFTVDWSPGDGEERYGALVRWPPGAREPVLTPSW